VHDQLAETLAASLDAGEIADATLADSEARAAALWRLREDLPEAERLDGAAVKNDVAVRVADIPRFLDAAIAAVARAVPGVRPFAFGHLGDGNLHLNFRAPEGASGKQWVTENSDAVRRALHDAVAAHGGSISAEHGIGTLKSAELARLADPAKLAAMRAIKAALDPHGIMNPGKLFA
jgi:FAD/FMN-containing dehydrogenase